MSELLLTIPVHTLDEHPIPLVFHKDIPEQYLAEYKNRACGKTTTLRDALYYYDAQWILESMNIRIKLVDTSAPKKLIP